MVPLRDRIGERYELGQVLGSGASGVVYEAFDRQRGARVAIKRLRRDGPLDVVRLKREFRTLADVAHPNLVRLLELVHDGDEVLLVMELVPGRSFLSWVWDRDWSGDSSYVAEETWSTLSGTPVGAEPRSTFRPTLDPETVRRLRVALRGLAAGLSGLHGHGLLHRDVKPSNVLITDDGDVVLVDFGLATRAGAMEARMAGTAGYMAPEQIGGESLTPASDWYGLGSLLYEALTGRTPFMGPAAHVLFAKRTQDPPDLRESVPDAPPDLAELCMALLRRSAADRPDADHICDVLGVTPSEVLPPVPFVGRQAEREALRAAFQRPGMRLVHVQGPSGLGKTRLVEQFLCEVDATVLAARCYERERAPFKALDPLVDALAELLAARLQDGAEDLVPEDLSSVARIFPALARIPGSRPFEPLPDPVAERRRATEALGDLLRRLAAQVPTVLWIDDLQWGDLDSVRMLARLLGGPEPPEVLVILSSRSDDPLSAELLEPLKRLPAEWLTVEPLNNAEARDLVLGALGAAPPDVVQRAVQEARGSPFFLAEIARWLAAGLSGDGPLLDGVVSWRVGALPDAARSVLEVVAVAARPVLPELALTAARHEAPDAGPGDLALLTIQRLLTTRRGRAVECTHDRIRETLTGNLGPEDLRERHRALALALGPKGDPELLSEHWARAGEPAQASRHALLGAEQAEQALAFDRAAMLYRRVLELGELDRAERLDVEIRLGRALARAGRAESADVLLRCAQQAPPSKRAALEREAAHQLLRCGRFEESYAILPRVVEQVGLRWPASRGAAIGELMWRNLRPGWLRRRPPADARERFELTVELAMSLSFADMLRAGVFSARGIDLAEQIGDPDTLALASAMRGSNAALLSDLALSERMLERSFHQLPPDASPRLRASVELHHGIAECVRGRFHLAGARLSRCVAAFQRAGGMAYEIAMAHAFLAYALVQTGQLDAFRALRAQVIEDAQLRGDRHTEVLFRTAFTLQPGLLDDDPDATEADLTAATARWGEGTSTVWLFTEISRALVDVYRGRSAPALERLLTAEGPAKRAGLLRINTNGVLLGVVLAAAAAPLASKGDGSARRHLRRAVRSLRSIPVEMAQLQADFWEGCDRALDGDRPGALAALDRAVARLSEVVTPWQLEMIEFQRARLTGNDPEPWLAALRARGMKNPERMVALYAWMP